MNSEMHTVHFIPSCKYYIVNGYNCNYCKFAYCYAQNNGGGGGGASRAGALASDALALSNDDYYVGRGGGPGAAGGPRGPGPFSSALALAGLSVQHSTPALELHRHSFPIAIPPNKLRQLYRTLLRRYKAGPMATQVAPAQGFPSASPERRRAIVPVINLAKHIRKKAKVLEHSSSYCVCEQRTAPVRENTAQLRS